MASKKDLKKDINFLTNEVIETCIVKMSFTPDIDNKKVFEIIDDFIEFRNQSIYKLNHPEKLNGKEKKNLKSYYNDILESFIEKVNQAFDKLNKVTQEKASK